MWSWLMVAAAAALWPIAHGTQWQTSPAFHGAAEFGSALISVIAGAACVGHFVGRADRAYLVAAVGFIASGVVDLTHGVVSMASSAGPLAASTEALGRFCLASALLTAGLIGERSTAERAVSMMRDAVRAPLAGLALGAAALAVVIVLTSLMPGFGASGLPKLMNVVSPLLFGAAALALARRFRAQWDSFSLSLVVAALIAGAAQVLVSGSTFAHEALFDAGHLVKLVGGLVPVAGVVFENVVESNALKQALRHVAKSEERYRQLLRETNTGLVVVDDQGIVLLANEPYLHLVGVESADALVGRSVIEWTAPEARSSNAAAVAQCAADGSIAGHRTTYVRPDGTRVHIEVDAVVEHGDEGDRLVAKCRDRTSEVEAEREVAAEQARFRDVAQCVADWVWEFDADMRYTYCSAQVETVTGRPPSALIGKTPFDMMTEEEAARVRPFFEQAIAEGAPIERLQTWRPTASGDRVWVQTSGVPVYDADGDLVGYRGAVQDVTALKMGAERLARQNAALAAANRTLAARNRELDEFTFIASHDLQEPLRKITSFCGLLREDVGDELPEQAETDIRFITESAQRMSQLIQDLLSLSRAGRSPLKREAVAVNKVVIEALESLSLVLEESGAEVTTDELPSVRASRTLLGQVYRNLIANALKFMGDRSPKVHMTIDTTGTEVIFGVRDNGIGIKPEYHHKIFAPFSRLHSRAEYDGSGIGLAICRKIIDRHGGRIWVESTPGEGAHFRFTLQMSAEDAPPLQTSTARESGSL